MCRSISCIVPAGWLPLLRFHRWKKQLRRNSSRARTFFFFLSLPLPPNRPLPLSSAVPAPSPRRFVRLFARSLLLSFFTESSTTPPSDRSLTRLSRSRPVFLSIFVTRNFEEGTPGEGVSGIELQPLLLGKFGLGALSAHVAVRDGLLAIIGARLA